MVDMYWQWEGEASSRTKSNIIFHPTQPHPFCKCVTMRRFSATHCIEVADSSGVVTFYAHVSLDFTPKNTAGSSSLMWFCFSSKGHIPWGDCPLYPPQPNFEASVVISIVGQSMVIALNAVGRLVTRQWRSLIDLRDSAMFALFLVLTHVTLVLDNHC